MNRLLLIIILCIALLESSCGQKPLKQNSNVALGIAMPQSSHQDSLLFKNLYLGDSSDLSATCKFPAKPLGWTSDFEHIFTKYQVAELDSIIGKFENETTNEIAIITIDSSWVTKENFDRLVTAILKEWSVGKKDVNNGVVIAVSKGLRMVRIDNGYGIEKKLTDEETKKIIEEAMSPEFKQANFFEGTKKGLLVLMQKIW